MPVEREEPAGTDNRADPELPAGRRGLRRLETARRRAAAAKVETVASVAKVEEAEEATPSVSLTAAMHRIRRVRPSKWESPVTVVREMGRQAPEPSVWLRRYRLFDALKTLASHR